MYTHLFPSLVYSNSRGQKLLCTCVSLGHGRVPGSLNVLMCWTHRVTEGSWKRRDCLPWTLLRHHSVVQERVDYWCHGRAPAGPDIKKRTRFLSSSGGHQSGAQATGRKRKITRHLEVRKHSTLSLTCCVFSAKSGALFPKPSLDFIVCVCVCVFLMRLIKQYLRSGPVPILYDSTLT